MNYLNPHITLGGDDEPLDLLEVGSKSDYFRSDVKPGLNIEYDDYQGTEFKGVILGFSMDDLGEDKGRIMFVKIEEEYTVIDALCHGEFIRQIY